MIALMFPVRGYISLTSIGIASFLLKSIFIISALFVRNSHVSSLLNEKSVPFGGQAHFFFQALFVVLREQAAEFIEFRNKSVHVLEQVFLIHKKQL